MRHRAVLCMLDGAVLYGTIGLSNGDSSKRPEPGELAGDAKQIYFESADGGHCGMIDTSSVKAIYIGDRDEPDLHGSPRFFDSAPIPASLWVRASLVDGEVVEGMIANAWSAISGPVLELHLPGSQSGHRKVLIPRTAITKLQVITTRS